MSAHLESRREVETILSAGTVPVTAFRAAMIIGSGSASFEILRYLRLGEVITSTMGRIPPIAAPIPAPTNADSESGVSRTRSGPKSWSSPRLTA